MATAVGSLLVAAGLALWGRCEVTRLLSLAMLSVSGFLCVVGAVFWKRPRTSWRAPKRELLLDLVGLALARGRSIHSLVSFRSGFGVTLFASDAGDLLVVSITSPHGIACVGACVDKNAAVFAPLLSNAIALPEAELRVACMLPNGLVLELEQGGMEALIHAILEIDPRAIQRYFLSDARGTPIVLDGTLLRAGSRTFDLAAPFEWRASIFQEPAGAAVARYQATWLRQAKDEVAFISLQTENEAPVVKPQHQQQIDKRWSQAPLETPPSRDSRVAVDRLFMFPLRRALHGAAQAPARSSPRSSRAC